MSSLSTLPVPELREHDFQSHTPVIGPLIRFVRRTLYGLTAKWGVWSLMQQQNQINHILERRLADQETRLVEQDRDLAHLSSALADLEVQQRHLLKLLQAQGMTIMMPTESSLPQMHDQD